MVLITEAEAFRQGGKMAISLKVEDAATFVAAKPARVPHGRAAVVGRRRSLTNGHSRDKAACIHGQLARASGGQGYVQHYSTTEPQ